MANFGINNVVQDPVLEVYDANGTLIAQNDDWQDDLFWNTAPGLSEVD